MFNLFIFLALLRGHMLAVADEEGGVCLYDTRKQGPSAKLKGIWTQRTSNTTYNELISSTTEVRLQLDKYIFVSDWIAHSNAIFDIAWVCNEPKLVSDTINRNILLSFIFFTQDG
jgi:hypothetical protein